MLLIGWSFGGETAETVLSLAFDPERPAKEVVDAFSGSSVLSGEICFHGDLTSFQDGVVFFFSKDRSSDVARGVVVVVVGLARIDALELASRVGGDGFP